MKKIKYCLVVFLFVWTFIHINNAYAQQYVFRILANKGSNLMKISSDNSDWQLVKTGMQLKKEDELMLGENAYIGLVHNSGKTIELKNPGAYKIADLINKITNTSTSMASKYADFVFAQMLQQDEIEFNKNPSSYTKSTGSVERSTAQIEIVGPASVNVFNPVTTIKWMPVENADLYTITVKNIFENIILTKKTSETELTLDLNDAALRNEKLLIVSVSTKKDKIISDNIGVKKLTNQEYASINKQLNILESEMKEETAMDKIIEAAFFEENNLLLDAITQYELAIKMAPDVDDFKILYRKFLTKYQ